MGSACLEVGPHALSIPELLSAKPAGRRHGYLFESRSSCGGVRRAMICPNDPVKALTSVCAIIAGQSDPVTITEPARIPPSKKARGIAANLAPDD